MSLIRRGYEKVGRCLKKEGTKEVNFSVLKGNSPSQKHTEVAVHDYYKATLEKTKHKEFKIYRWNPENPNSKPFLQSFHLDLAHCGPMVLDALLKIKADVDSTLSYRRSCREGVCGSCAMNIDGTNTLACLKPIDTDTSKAIIITPLPRMFVIKDLVVDLTKFCQQYKLIEPWLKAKKLPEDGREFRQSPADRKKLDGLYECLVRLLQHILSVLYWWNPAEFLGPAALLQVYRWMSDSRDDFAKEWLQALTEDKKKLYRCRTIQNCTKTCPKSLNPAKAISMMRGQHLLSHPIPIG